jgi:hypothetical protein
LNKSDSLRARPAPGLPERAGRDAGVSPKLSGQMSLVGESKIGGDHRQTVASRRDFVDRSAEPLHGEKTLRRAACRCSHSPLQRPDRSTDTVRQVADAAVRCIQGVASLDGALPCLPRKREQGPIHGVEDVDARRTLRADARQRIATRDDRRIVDARRTGPIRLELDADDPTHECPAFSSVIEARLVEDHLAARTVFPKYEGELPERGSEGHAAFGQTSPVLQDVDRVDAAGLIVARRELGVERGAGEDLLVVFGGPSRPRLQMWIFRWQSRAPLKPAAASLTSF